MNLPNKLTVARCLMAVIFVVLLSFEYTASYVAGYVVFTLAAITDYYDGKIARERNLVTNFGKLLDPVADKVLMMAAFLMLLQIDVLRIPAWTIIAILARELLITGARSLAAAEGEVLAAIGTGKAKTVLQMVYVFVFLLVAILLQALQEYPSLAAFLPGNPGIWVDGLGLVSRVSIIAVAAYTLYSGVDFARANWHILRLDKTS